MLYRPQLLINKINYGTLISKKNKILFALNDVKITLKITVGIPVCILVYGLCRHIYFKG